VERQSTGIHGLDQCLGGGIPRGTRAILLGPPGAGKTVFTMQFLWAGLRAGETVSYGVFDRPWPKLQAYFESFGWDAGEKVDEGRLIPVQAFPHFEPFPRDPRVRYLDLGDFEEMKRVDLDLAEAGTTRFAFGDSYEHIFTEGREREWHRVEQWTVNWSHHSRMTNLDVIQECEARSERTQRLMDFTFLLADHVLRFRTRETKGGYRRELRFERMEGVAHPLDWIPFRIGGAGIELL
jgi:circadian clock protein KaiC